MMKDFITALFIHPLIASFPPNPCSQSVHLDPAPPRSTKVGSKVITIKKHYHSSSSACAGNNDRRRVPQITALTDV